MPRPRLADALLLRVERARVLRVIGRLERMPASDAAPLDFLWAPGSSVLESREGGRA